MKLANPDANPHVKAVREYVKGPTWIPRRLLSRRKSNRISSIFREDERRNISESLGVKESGVGALIRAAYRSSACAPVYRQAKRRRGRGYPPATRPRPAAGVIHSDFERGFIRGGMHRHEELVASLGSFAKAARGRSASASGRREYTVQDGDVLEFRFNV